ncbi:MAG: carbohydrate kinase family protein [Desulfobaccales bacterium]
MKPYVACLGAINLDLLYEVDGIEAILAALGSGLTPGGRAILSPEEEAKLTDLLARGGRLISRFGGGRAAQTAYALSRLEVPAVLLGRVGADEDGAFLQESLVGVHLDHVVRKGVSGRTYLLVDPKGERTVLTAPNTNDRLREEDLPLEVVAGSAFFHVSSFAGDGPLEAQRRLLLRLAGSLRVCFDPGELYARRGREALTDILDQTETLLVTEREWEQLGGDLNRHPDWGPPVILVKRDERGSRMLTPVRYLDFPPYVLDRREDALGAGDVFAAGYIAGLFQGLNLPQAVRLGISLAAYALEGPDRLRYPDRALMEAVVASLR